MECLAVCPFEDHETNEDSLGEALYGQVPVVRYAEEIGYYRNSYVGHVADPDHRWQGASGGMATWFLRELLVSCVVDRVICVTPNPDPNRLFRFEIISDPADLLRSAKSAYYPVELSGALHFVLENPGRYALIGLPCFVKAIRLAASRNAKIGKRIEVVAGLTCGQLKTKCFAESIARRMSLAPEQITRLCFRHKTHDRPATNFSITVSGERLSGTIEWNNFYVMAWMTGMFKIRSCDYCDDIYSELADISFMDAWLPEYSDVSAGTSIVITRSALAEAIIQDKGIRDGACQLKPIPIARVMEAQAGVIEQKRRLLSHRLWVADRKGWPRPKKRVSQIRPNVLEYLMILNANAIRRRSFSALARQRESGKPGLDLFIMEMKPLLEVRKWLHRFKTENIRSGIRRRLKRLMESYQTRRRI